MRCWTNSVSYPKIHPSKCNIPEWTPSNAEQRRIENKKHIKLISIRHSGGFWLYLNRACFHTIGLISKWSDNHIKKIWTNDTFWIFTNIDGNISNTKNWVNLIFNTATNCYFELEINTSQQNYYISLDQFSLLTK